MPFIEEKVRKIVYCAVRMEILRTISFYCESHNMSFLIIGGHAVNHYGIARQTGDIDILVPLNKKLEWDELLKKLNYTSLQSDTRFARYKADVIAEWPIDLMFVDDKTFSKMFHESESAKMGPVSVRFASAKHIAILKIHALKHFQAHRSAKDFGDLIGLIKSTHVSFDNDELLEICKKYASEDLFLKIQTELRAI